MELVETAVLGACHEDAAVGCCNDGGHFDVGGIHLDLCAVCLEDGGGREADEEDGEGSAEDHEGGNVIDEDIWFWTDNCDVGDDVWLVDKCADVLAVGCEWVRGKRRETDLCV
jgi:hypothetical protein